MNSEIDFAYWRQLEILAVWEIASLMKGYDPRWLPDCIEDPEGNPVDLSHEERSIRSAMDIGKLTPSGTQTDCEGYRGVSREQAVGWLRDQGRIHLAEALAGRPMTSEEYEDELLRQYERRCGAPTRTSNGRRKWRFPGSGRLLSDLQAEGREISENTLRTKLTNAANRRASGGAGASVSSGVPTPHDPFGEARSRTPDSRS